MAYNGPAIWGGCVTRHKHRAESWYFSRETVTVQGGYGTCFCSHGTNFIACWRDRSTSLIRAGKLSRYRILIGGTGAVSRYKLSRSQKLVKVQDFNCVQMRVSGCNIRYKFVLSAGAKAKTVTNNLPILSVLGKVLLFFKGHKHYYGIIKFCKSFGQFFQLPFFPWEFRNTVFKIIAGYMVFKIICFYPHYHS
jgi:hypothetical protein